MRLIIIHQIGSQPFVTLEGNLGYYTDSYVCKCSDPLLPIPMYVWDSGLKKMDPICLCRPTAWLPTVCAVQLAPNYLCRPPTGSQLLVPSFGIPTFSTTTAVPTLRSTHWTCLRSTDRTVKNSMSSAMVKNSYVTIRHSIGTAIPTVCTVQLDPN